VDADAVAVAVCTVAVVAVPSRAISSRATARVVTLAGVVITEIAIMAIGVVVLSWVVVDTIKVLEARLFAVAGKATRIPTFRGAGGTTVAAGALALEMVLWLPRAFWPTPRAVGRRMKIGGISLISRLLGSRFRISPGLGA